MPSNIYNGIIECIRLIAEQNKLNVDTVLKLNVDTA
jgi:hypothetical protein